MKTIYHKIIFDAIFLRPTITKTDDSGFYCWLEPKGPWCHFYLISPASYKEDNPKTVKEYLRWYKNQFYIKAKAIKIPEQELVLMGIHL